MSLIFQCKFTPGLIDAYYSGYVSSFDFKVCKKEVEEDGRKIVKYEKITKVNNQDEPVFKAARLQRFYSSSGYAYANMCSDKEKVMFEIDQILNNSYVPIMFHVYNNDNENEHWALIIGKVDGNYQIYDPYFVEIGVLEDTMQYYRNDYNGNWSYEYGVIIKSYE